MWGILAPHYTFQDEIFLMRWKFSDRLNAGKWQLLIQFSQSEREFSWTNAQICRVHVYIRHLLLHGWNGRQRFQDQMIASLDPSVDRTQGGSLLFSQLVRISLLSVPLLQHGMGQIMKSLVVTLSFCLYILLWQQFWFDFDFWPKKWDRICLGSKFDDSFLYFSPIFNPRNAFSVGKFTSMLTGLRFCIEMSFQLQQSVNINHFYTSILRCIQMFLENGEDLLLSQLLWQQLSLAMHAG